MRILFYIALFYFIYRYVMRMFKPQPQNKNTSRFQGGIHRNKNNSFNQIEEADFEDITDKDE